MPSLFTLSCPTCNGRLDISDDLSSFACGYCGNEHIVQRKGGTISLKPVIEHLGQIESGTDRTASELAINRLSSEIEALETRLGGILRRYKNDTESILITPKGAYGSAGILMLFGFFAILLVFSPNNSSPGDSCFMGLMGVGLFIIGLYAIQKHQSYKENVGKGKKEIFELRKMIYKKKSEMNRHQEIVSR